MDNATMNMMQRRVMAREAVGKLQAISEMFYSDIDSGDDFKKWVEGVRKIESWIFDESPIA